MVLGELTLCPSPTLDRKVTALSQPDAEALRTEIRKAKALLRHPDLPLGVNLTVLPQLASPDYPAIIQVTAWPSSRCGRY